MELKIHSKNNPTYPCLKQNNQCPSLIVLFTDTKTGIVIRSDSTWKVGHYANDWAENKFTVISGTISF
jgi:hypothetical protein